MFKIFAQFSSMSLVVVHVDLLLDGLRVVKDLLAMRVVRPS